LGAKDGQLHFVHRLDKNCTGVVVYPKTPEMASLLRSSFAQKKVKIYWAILKGTPDPAEGNTFLIVAAILLFRFYCSGLFRKLEECS
jgi:23S rRNA-/tRNA-specific pseudouridylate synthase